MKPRDRVIAALNHQEPDRVPTGENAVDYLLVEEILGHGTLYNSRWREVEALWQGRRAEIVADYITVHIDLVKTLGWDYVRVPVVPRDREYTRPVMTGPHSWLDDEGNELRFHPEHGAIITKAEDRGMTLDQLPAPDEDFEVHPSELEAVKAVAAELGGTHFIIGRTPVDGTFPFVETVGMEEYLLRMIKDPGFVKAAMEAYVLRSLKYIEAMLDAGCDAIMTTDDYCDNKGPIMGPKLFEKFILPGIVKQAELTHSKGAYFIKHTDGNTWRIMDMLLEAGIDGWHGIQPSIGMDLAKLNEKYGERLCFFGGVNCETLIDGSPRDVENEVKAALKGAAAGGGLVIASGNVLQPGVKYENYLAGLNTTKRFGNYPISL